MDEFRTMLYSCGAPITEEEFCMLVDKYDVNGDGSITDTELLAQVCMFVSAHCIDLWAPGQMQPPTCVLFSVVSIAWWQ